MDKHKIASAIENFLKWENENDYPINAEYQVMVDWESDYMEHLERLAQIAWELRKEPV